MVIRTSFWPLGGQSETDPYDPGKVFFEVNEPTSPFIWENDIEAGTYRLRLGGPGGNNWSYIGTNRGGSGAGIDSEFELLSAAHLRITVGSKGTDSRLEIRNPANPAEYLPIVVCGKGSDEGATWGGGAGGVLTVNARPDLIIWSASPYVWSNGINGAGSGSSDTASVFTGQNYSRGNHHGTGKLEYLRLKLDAAALAELDKNRGGVSRWLRFKKLLKGLGHKVFYYFRQIIIRRLP